MRVFYCDRSWMMFCIAVLVMMIGTAAEAQDDIGPAPVRADLAGVLPPHGPSDQERPAPSIRIQGDVKGEKGRVDLHIEFVPDRRERIVNMDSLEITYLNMFGMDITYLVRPYIQQNKIIAHSLEFPPGEHKFHISIRDDQDIESARSITFRVH